MQEIFTSICYTLAAYGLTAMVGYLLGSISFAVIFTWLFIKKDIRSFGSGNAGATNVFRSVGVPAGILTFVCDFAKGAAAIVCGRALFAYFDSLGAYGTHDSVMIGASVAGLFALLGHLFPVYFGFKGGKGVLTVGGIILIISPVTLLVLLVLFAVVFAITRTVSIGSIAVAVGYPIVTFIVRLCVYLSDPAGSSVESLIIQTVVAVIYAIIVIYMHRSNIKRIIAGTEQKLVIKKAETGE